MYRKVGRKPGSSLKAVRFEISYISMLKDTEDGPNIMETLIEESVETSDIGRRATHEGHKLRHIVRDEVRVLP